MPAVRAAGYGLLEVLITLAVSLITLSALARLQGELFRGDAQARARSQAVLLAEQRLEALHAALAAAGLEAAGDGADALNPDLAPVEEDATALYRRSWTVIRDAATATAQIEVRVEWRDTGDRPQAVHLAALVASAPPGLAAARLAPVDFVRLE